MRPGDTDAPAVAALDCLGFHDFAALSGLATFTAHAAEFILQPVFMLKMGLILAGGGVICSDASAELAQFAEHVNVPVYSTFMGKGAIDDRSHLSLMAVGLQARDHVLTGFDRADLVICVGYDLVEYALAHSRKR